MTNRMRHNSVYQDEYKLMQAYFCFDECGDVFPRSREQIKKEYS